MQLVITIRREVANREQGESIYNVVKERLEEHPDLKVTGHVTNHFNEIEEPS